MKNIKNIKKIDLDPETNFLRGLIELQYGLDVKDKLKHLTDNIAWAKNWPENNLAFWNAEAFMWGRKISTETRNLISAELSFLAERDGKNLDLGCGAYSYLKSVGVDFSSKMLQFNDNCQEKIITDLEKKLPLTDDSFASATAIFVLNYINDYQSLISEIKRVLFDKGIFVMVLSATLINDWQRQKQVNNFSSQQWIDELQSAGFSVTSYEKNNLWFFKCVK